jgi:hypothetical protein
MGYSLKSGKMAGRFSVRSIAWHPRLAAAASKSWTTGLIIGNLPFQAGGRRFESCRARQSVDSLSEALTWGFHPLSRRPSDTISSAWLVR